MPPAPCPVHVAIHIFLPMSRLWDFILGEHRHDKLRQQLRPLLPSYWKEKRRWPVTTGPLVWNGRELDPSNYTYWFSPADLHEIRGALDGFGGPSPPFQFLA
jgi:hypothetical protein